VYLFYGLISWYAIAHHRVLPPSAEAAGEDRVHIPDIDA
jgi:hypothetical protein